jgi:WD40 repeat protein
MDGNTFITDLRNEQVIHCFEEPKQNVTSVQFNPKTYTMTTGCEGRCINYYDLENFATINSMSFNTSAVKEIEFYNKDEFEYVECGFFGGDDYIRLINCEKNQQTNIYSVPHDTLCDMKIDYKNGLLTCLCTYQSDMVFWGVKLPEIDEDQEVDMDVDQAYDAPITSASSAAQQQYEENKAAVQAKYDDFRSSQQTSHAVPPAKGDSFDRSRISQPDSALDKTTFRHNPDSAPADLDYDDFIAKPSSVDMEVIDKLQDKHLHFMDNLKQRHQKINNILSLYSPYKNINMTLNALEQMNDIGVTNDV